MARTFVVFPTEADRMDSATALFTDAEATIPYLAANDPRILIADLPEEEIEAAKATGCEVFDDFRLQLFPNLLEYRSRSWRFWEPASSISALRTVAAPPVWQTKTLTNVLDHIKAPQAWVRTRGKGVTIVVVDTGVCAQMPEFPSSKRSIHSFSFASPGRFWEDSVGHGSMCACIAAATDQRGGRYNGVAPEATLLSARTSLWSSDIYKIYDHLITLKRTGAIQGPLVVSNSYGLYTCSPPHWPEGHPYRRIVERAVSQGIIVVFAAGNDHYDVLCNYPPQDCSPNTIWAVNSIDDVITVGTVNWDNSNQVPGEHANSSRGPGQWSASQENPDCVAPTYGEVVWGCGYQVMEWWGTSGACPQVAGLSALLLSINPNLKPQDVKRIIKDTAAKLPSSSTCVGAGLIDCKSAIASIA
jgi:subtilisin family serine protease